MQWGQIKTLFILCFLLLDIYLLFLVIQKIGNEDFGPANDSGQLEDLDQLELENIKISIDLPDPLPDEVYLTIREKTFTKEEVEEIIARDNQDIEVINNSFIISMLKEKIAIPENATEEVIEQIIFSTVYLGSEYTFDYWDKERNILVFFQEKNDRPVYYHSSGIIFVYLNDDNEIDAYTQTVLGEVEPSSDKKSLISPLKAIMRLYQSNLLLPNDEVTDIKIGYYSMFPPVVVPTWKITIDGKQNRYVNAIERFVIPVNDGFMDDMIQKGIESTRSITKNEELHDQMIEILMAKLMSNRSESE
ncbi:two-component system regulatory protein YycI [Ornithinibacillus halotolerans]|uniref:Regulatory protein YycH-like domain-containing protein n=1 Tax=Ornithinibacillus halotolerans TaxID=1274357 RepID=A0A916RTU1_9BACI|nr:two-component system regulatory protein YycI [Ornithinibacillus halotolerans]GGA70192.1 hypothetical protein GCM10008025_12600 [Ornithinibacillus halotolerans]